MANPLLFLRSSDCSEIRFDSLRIFQGCFIVQLSRFLLSLVSGNLDMISRPARLVNGFFMTLLNFD
ncbi:hypothetical protein GCWU000342_00845 [Shuttleworthella satelles DSM 14600]|uniref:Uncharacterized protein n=1 Tax=Shuttleworthella satelles DSM 14600 TaxID=626523 RepID=C4GA33_9FIRM|nr:hypothetical protein GCWU000342_00845 [Shuttleworthia satelles DSM 14600]